MKKCTKCGEEKPATNEFFSRIKSGTYDFKDQCKKCNLSRGRSRVTYSENESQSCVKCKREKPTTVEFWNIRRGKLATQCRDCYNLGARRHYTLNRDRILQSQRKQDSNVSHGARTISKTVRRRLYKLNNRDKINAHNVERRRTDKEYAMVCNLRHRMRKALKGIAKSAATLELLGCTVEQWRAHIESLFKPGMTWENYGTVWHIDHVEPLAAFDLSDPEEQKKAFSWMNTQPLWAEENLRKGASLEYSY